MQFSALFSASLSTKGLLKLWPTIPKFTTFTWFKRQSWSSYFLQPSWPIWFPIYPRVLSLLYFWCSRFYPLPTSPLHCKTSSMRLFWLRVLIFLHLLAKLRPWEWWWLCIDTLKSQRQGRIVREKNLSFVGLWSGTLRSAIFLSATALNTIRL